MNRLFAVKPLLVVTAALAIALFLACGGRGETASPGSLLRLLPQNPDSFTFADLEQPQRRTVVQPRATTRQPYRRREAR